MNLSSSSRHFARHYIEMVIVMFSGMAVLGVPAGWVLSAMGSSWSALSDEGLRPEEYTCGVHARVHTEFPAAVAA